jgi:methylglyoxal/glyoxal reductase
VVRWALDAGYRHIDTARLYGNEASVGKAVRESSLPREDIWVTTKLWPTDFINPRKALKESLRRFGLDYVDLYLVHWPTPVPIPGFDQKLWHSMEQLADEGLAKTIGVSNFLESRLQNILSSANIPPAVNQVKCSPFAYPRKLHQFCRENNIALEAYEPLTQGSRLDDPFIGELAVKYHKTPAQVMLRWALQKGIIVIPKSRHHERIIENAALFDFALSNEDMEQLSILSSNSR